MEREAAARDLTGTATPEAITASDIERILDELGGLGHVLSTAEPTEKAQVYASLGLRLRYQLRTGWWRRPTWAVSLVVSEDRVPR